MILRVSHMAERDGTPVTFRLTAYRVGERVSSNLYTERQCGDARQWVMRVCGRIAPDTYFGLEDASKLLDAKEMELNEVIR